MKFIKSHVRLFEILFCVFSFFLAVMIALYCAGVQNQSIISNALGASTSRVENSEDDEDVDAEYFKPTYTDTETVTAEQQLKDAYEKICREVEEEGMVLLKNDDNALPLSEGSKVSLFAYGSVNLNYAASGSSDAGDSSSYDSLKDGLENSGLEVNETLWNFYLGNDYAGYGRGSDTNHGYYINEAPYSAYPSSVKNTYSSYGDAAIVTISRDSGEGRDVDAVIPTLHDSQAEVFDDRYYGENGNYLALSGDEVDLLKNLKLEKQAGNIKKIIVVLNTSATVQLDFLNNSDIDVDALLWVGNVGSEGANAIGEVLTGKVNPSGRNVDTYLYNNLSSPAMASWMENDESLSSVAYSNYSDYGSRTGTTNRYYAVYVEGIYVGYRYYETRYEDSVMGTGNTSGYDYNSDVAYPFGYGLSYTSFSYSDFDVTEAEDGESYDVSVTVTNTGDVAGKEAVEVYLQKPYTDYDKASGVEKASVELVGYAKTDMLDAAGGDNDSQTLTINVQKEQYKSYDSTEAKTYILEDGNYYLTVAHDSHVAVNNILAKKASDGDTSVDTDKMDDDGDASFVYCDTVSTGYSDGVDAVTYSTSTETGAAITNQLDDADVNRYSGSGTNSVTYVSRSDWDNTFPTSATTLIVGGSQMWNDLQSDVKEYDQSPYEIPTYGADNGLTLAMLRNNGTQVEITDGVEDEGDAESETSDDGFIAYDDEMWEELLDQMTFAEQSLLVSDGYHQTNAIESVSKPQTVDENGPTSVSGSITGYCLPSEGIWAATLNDELIERVGNLMGDDCIMAGLQGLYAPGVNIHRTGYCGRSHEYFSEDPYLSGMASVAEIKGIQDRGVIAYVKHFAFNDEEQNRNGVCIWLNEQSAREIYLLPFEYSMRPSMGNSHACMTSFNRAGCTWTSATYNLLEVIARGEWNYEGFYITDASSGNGATYMTYYDGVMNGTNLYDGTGTSSAFNSWSNNTRLCYMLRESCHRIMYNVVNYSAAMNGITAGTTITVITPWWLVLVIVLLVIAAVGTAAALVFYVLAEVFKRIGKGKDSGDGGGAEVQEDQTDSSGGAESSSDLE